MKSITNHDNEKQGFFSPPLPLLRTSHKVFYHNDTNPTPPKIIVYKDDFLNEVKTPLQLRFSICNSIVSSINKAGVNPLFYSESFAIINCPLIDIIESFVNKSSNNTLTTNDIYNEIFKTLDKLFPLITHFRYYVTSGIIRGYSYNPRH